jgi:hypothetical protein
LNGHTLHTKYTILGASAPCVTDLGQWFSRKRGMTMRRFILFGLLTSLLLWSVAQATPDVTILCWNTAIDGSPLIDTLRIALQEIDPDAGGFAIPALRWFAPGLYLLTAPASAYLNADAPGVVNLTTYLDNRSQLFRGNENCRLRLTFELDLLNGVAQLACTGTDEPFTAKDAALLPDPTCGQTEALRIGVSGDIRGWAVGDEQFNVYGR